MRLTIESATEDAKAVQVAEGETLTFETCQRAGKVYFTIDLIDAKTTTAFLLWEGTKQELKDFLKEMMDSIDDADVLDEVSK
ncbi:TPA: hypothetical protein HA251_05605 [Candidatus Woesearchaeota archaeon]|nr:hypothetical protein [Candidatus Woesearchaeota archaeon]